MQEEVELKRFTNVISGTHTITQQRWSLSLVRRFGSDHAFLIVEGIDANNERIVRRAHLVNKCNNPDKALVIYDKDISNRLEELHKMGETCSCYTWNITLAKASQFETLIESEVGRSQRDEINYIYWGKSKMSGFFTSLPEDMKASLEEHSNNNSMDALLRDGHNCATWAIGMVRALELPFKGDYVPFVVCIPKMEIEGQHNGDEEATRNCLMM